MKDLYLYIMEEGEGGGVAATPGNTMGMGNPTPPGEGGEPGSEPMVTAKTKIHIKNKKKKRTLVESLLDDEEELVNDNTVLIEQFLKDNYEISGSHTIKNGVVDVIGKIKLSNKSLKHLTNNLFKFGTVRGKFICASSDITSLEGAPDQVDYFSCRRCNNLLSLKYSPKYVGNTFTCSNCPKLKNLEGSPVEVNNFYCCDCASLSSLKGLPKKISGDLECNGCSKLKIKEFEKYLPDIGGDLYCDSDINKQLNHKGFNFKVGGDIYSN